jgi:hypothetical protein
MEELLGRHVPYSATAEQAVIGSMLIDVRCVPDVLEKVRADEFYIKDNRDIFETIYAMFSYAQTIDPVTVLEQMKIRGVYEERFDNYLAQVMSMTPTAANVLEYAAIVRDKALLRRLGDAADEIASMVNEGAGEAETLLESAERKIYALRQDRNVGGLQPLSMVLQRVYANLSEVSANGGKIPGLSTGDFHGYPSLLVETPHSTAAISLFGGQLLSFVPKGGTEVMWLSPSAQPTPTPIRGGTPVCWPYFGRQDQSADVPAHGFYRKQGFRDIPTATMYKAYDPLEKI